MIHLEKSPLKGKHVRLITGDIALIEDWFDRVTGKSWTRSEITPAVANYSFKVAKQMLPTDNEVLYGKIKGLGFLIHMSELETINGQVNTNPYDCTCKNSLEFEKCIKPCDRGNHE